MIVIIIQRSFHTLKGFLARCTLRIVYSLLPLVGFRIYLLFSGMAGQVPRRLYDLLFGDQNQVRGGAEGHIRIDCAR
jgi:hypothetical protein